MQGCRDTLHTPYREWLPLPVTVPFWGDRGTVQAKIWRNSLRCGSKVPVDHPESERLPLPSPRVRLTLKKFVYGMLTDDLERT